MTKGFAKNGLITALDIGTNKICCLIAKKSSKNGLKIVSSAVCPSAGFSNGRVNNIKQLENAVRNTLATAEEKISYKVTSVFVNFSSPSIVSYRIGADARISSAPVTEKDVDKVLAKALENLYINDGIILHKIPLSYIVDGEQGCIDPRGVNGKTLGAELNVVYAKQSSVSNLHEVLTNSFVDVSKMIVSPYASGLATVSPDEKNLGCTVIDFGAGSIGLAYFEQEKLEYAACIPVGSEIITYDIAKVLSCPLSFAEELKIREGSAFCSPFRMQEMIPVKLTGNEEDFVSRQKLTEIINDRLKELFRLVRYKLSQDGFYNTQSRRIVLTGGGAELQGIKETAREVFEGKQIRIAYPQLSGLPENMYSPAFSTVAGLLKYIANADEYVNNNTSDKEKKTKFGRIGQWFLQSF